MSQLELAGQPNIFAAASYPALCSLEGLAYLLRGDDVPFVNSNQTRNLPDKRSMSIGQNPILEIGAGVGTLTRLLLKVFENPIVCFELDDYCIQKLEEFKESLCPQLGGRLAITKNLRNLDSEMCATHSIANGYYGLVIDGPILGRDLLDSIRRSKNLRFVFVERYRLIQRAQVALFLFRCGFQQQYFETRHNSRTTGAFFVVDISTNGFFSQKIRAFVDFFITCLRLYPKLAKNLYQSKGRNFKVGRYQENSKGVTGRILKNQ